MNKEIQDQIDKLIKSIEENEHGISSDIKVSFDEAEQKYNISYKFNPVVWINDEGELKSDIFTLRKGD